jgi:hypothetical protein
MSNAPQYYYIHDGETKGPIDQAGLIRVGNMKRSLGENMKYCLVGTMEWLQFNEHFPVVRGENAGISSHSDRRKRMIGRVWGSILGGLLGFSISYYFQPEAVRMKIPLGRYIVNIGNVLTDADLAGTAIICMAPCAIVGFVIGFAIDSNIAKR